MSCGQGIRTPHRILCAPGFGVDMFYYSHLLRLKVLQKKQHNLHIFNIAIYNISTRLLEDKLITINLIFKNHALKINNFHLQFIPNYEKKNFKMLHCMKYFIFQCNNAKKNSCITLLKIKYFSLMFSIISKKD